MNRSEPLDTTIRALTPEGTELILPAAGPAVRFLAFLTDTVIRWCIALFALLLLSQIQIFGSWVTFLLLFALEWFYPVIFEILDRGRTPGKRLLGLQVVMLDGTPVNPGASVLRNLLRAADSFLFFALIGLVSMMVTRGFRRPGDLAAGTLVIYSGISWFSVLPRNWSALSDIDVMRPAIPLEEQEKAAIVSLAGRSDLLGPARSAELAGMAAGLLVRGGTFAGNTSDEESAMAIIRCTAAWIQGTDLRGENREDGR